MELSIRLNKIVEIFEPCKKAVDIGTDHGYIPIYLVKNKLCEYAIAADINKGPLEKAKSNIASFGLMDKIETRRGSGLSVIKEGEVNAAIMAGMGGNLIRDIILQDMKVFKSLDFAILQPAQNPEVLRKFLYERGFEVLEEELCYDMDRYYEVIKVRYGNLSNAIKNEADYEVSPMLFSKRHPLLLEFLEHKIYKYKEIINYIGDNTPNALVRKKDILNKIQYLEEKRNDFKN